MPKLKTNRAAAKRFTRTGGGGFKRNGAYHNHILTKKSPKRLRRMRAGGMVAAVDCAEVRKLLPYS